MAGPGAGSAAGGAVVLVHTQTRLQHQLTVEVEVSTRLVYTHTHSTATQCTTVRLERQPRQWLDQGWPYTGKSRLPRVSAKFRAPFSTS